MTTRARRLPWVAGLSVLAVGLGTALGLYCSPTLLTPDEAEKELDVACGVLIRTVAEAHHQAPLSILSRVCQGKQTHELLDRLLDHLLADTEPDELFERTFPVSGPDGGAP